MTEHPDIATLRRLVGSLDEEGQHHLAHLLTCAPCRRRARSEGPPAGRVLGFPGRGSYAPALARLDEAFAAALGGRHEALRVSSGDPSVGVAHFLEEAADSLFHDSRRAEALARLALVRVDAMGGDARRLGRDLEGRAWVLLGHARRLSGDPDGAEASLERAAACLEGSWDPVETARLLHAQSIQRRNQGRFGEAFELLCRAGILYQEVGDVRRQAHVLASTGALFSQQGQPVRAVAPLRRALALAEAEGDEKGIFAARHNLALCLAEMGQVHAAARLWESCREGYERFRGDPVQWRGLWLEALLAERRGEEDKAERLYLFVRDWLRARGDVHQTALVSLELIRLYARRGAADRLRDLLGELAEELAETSLHPEAQAAFAHLHRVATTGDLDPTRVREATLAFQRSRFRP